MSQYHIVDPFRGKAQAAHGISHGRGQAFAEAHVRCLDQLGLLPMATASSAPGAPAQSVDDLLGHQQAKSSPFAGTKAERETDPASCRFASSHSIVSGVEIAVHSADQARLERARC